MEGNGIFGGVATAGLVDIWHTLYDANGGQQIIGGLTLEMIERLKLRDAVKLHDRKSIGCYAVFNPPEMTIELDRMVVGAGRIRPFLHTHFVRPVLDAEGHVDAAIIEDKTGRRAIKAKCFVDASGDGDLVHRAGFPTWKGPRLQPPTTGAVISGVAELCKANPNFDIASALLPKYNGGFKHVHMWMSEYVGFPGMNFMAEPCVEGADCSDADSLTAAEIEGRRQIRALFDVIRSNFKEGDKLRLAALGSSIGIRETRRCEALHRLTENELLSGERFPDAIANGCYPVDVHDNVGITFKYLDGTSFRQKRSPEEGCACLKGRWREETADNPLFYQIPYRSLVPKSSRNVLCAGRIVDSDEGAFGAIRVMVNCNQTGEAAGIAAAMCATSGASVTEVNCQELREKLSAAGAIVL